MADDLTKEQITSKLKFFCLISFNDATLRFFSGTVLRRAFDMFDREKKGSIACNMVGGILRTLGQTFEESDLQSLIEEIDADGTILLIFGNPSSFKLIKILFCLKLIGSFLQAVDN